MSQAALPSASRMFQRPDAYVLLPLAGIGEQFLQGGMEIRAMVHASQMAELVAEYVIDERQGQFYELGGQCYLPPHGTAPPASFEGTHTKAGNDGLVFENVTGTNFKPAQSASQDQLRHVHAPCLESGFNVGRGLTAAGELKAASRESGMSAAFGRDRTEEERPAEEEYGTAFVEVGGAPPMFKEEALLFLYPD